MAVTSCCLAADDDLATGFDAPYPALAMTSRRCESLIPRNASEATGRLDGLFGGAGSYPVPLGGQ